MTVSRVTRGTVYSWRGRRVVGAANYDAPYARVRYVCNPKRLPDFPVALVDLLTQADMEARASLRRKLLERGRLAIIEEVRATVGDPANDVCPLYRHRLTWSLRDKSWAAIRKWLKYAGCWYDWKAHAWKAAANKQEGK